MGGSNTMDYVMGGLKTVGGAVMTAIPGMQPVGIPMMMSGVGQLAGDAAGGSQGGAAGSSIGSMLGGLGGIGGATAGLGGFGGGGTANINPATGAPMGLFGSIEHALGIGGSNAGAAAPNMAAPGTGGAPSMQDIQSMLPQWINQTPPGATNPPVAGTGSTASGYGMTGPPINAISTQQGSSPQQAAATGGGTGGTMSAIGSLLTGLAGPGGDIMKGLAGNTAAQQPQKPPAPPEMTAGRPQPGPLPIPQAAQPPTAAAMGGGQPGQSSVPGGGALPQAAGAMVGKPGGPGGQMVNPVIQQIMAMLAQGTYP